jgi:hypothetical protein
MYKRGSPSVLWLLYKVIIVTTVLKVQNSLTSIETSLAV